MNFKLGKNGKITVTGVDTELFREIREYFSVPINLPPSVKRQNRFLPSRKYLITPTGQCEVGMYWEIINFLYLKQKIVEVVVEDKLKKVIECGNYKQLKFEDNLNLKLRPYQQDVVQTALNFGRGICILGTGGGKTLITASLIENYFKGTSDNKFFKCLVIVPDLSLVNQTYTEFTNFGVSFSVTKWTGSYVPNLDSNVIICNIAILQSQIDKNEWVKWVDLLIVDEAHKAQAPIFSKIINGIDTPHKYGFTGTIPDKNEAKWSVLGKLGPILYVKNSAELRQEKFLTDVEVKVLTLTYKGRLITDYREELEYITQNKFRNDIIKQICCKFNNNILILVNKITHGEILQEYLKDVEGKQIFFIQGSVEVDERDRIKQLMEENNNIICIAMSSIFSTGVNIKNLHLIFFAAGGKSFIRTVQSIGRGLRLHARKNKLILIDIQDNLKYGFSHGEERKKIYEKEQIKYSTKTISES